MSVALNSPNLAVFGALDDFYDVYCAIESVYNKHRRLFAEQNGPEKKFDVYVSR